MKRLLPKFAVSSLPYAPPMEATIDGGKSSGSTWESDGMVAEVAVGDDRLSQTKMPACNWVVVLAFGQSLLFLLFWLFFCAAAGAATRSAGRPEDNLQLQESTYQHDKHRDPFAPVGAASKNPEGKSIAANPTDLHLEGILYQPGNPAAIVNGHLLSLNKTVSVPLGGGSLPVKAIRISQEVVVLEVDGKTVELRAGPPPSGK